MRKLLTENRKKINQELLTAKMRRDFSPATFGDYLVTKPAIEQYARGKLLDIGCGTMPFKDLIAQKVTQYDTFDVESRVDGVTFNGDIQDMTMIPDGTYDSAVCFEVLEHVPDPFRAAREISRILKKDGVLIFSVPHLSRLHEEPHDYYRYTKYGIQYLFKQAGFEIVLLKTRGGILSFLGHQFSSIFVCLFWGIPVLKQITFFINKWFCTRLICALESLIKTDIMPLGYTGVAKKIV